MSRSSQKPRRRCPAFSLVEVVLALGIVSFCLISLLGLVPVGLKAVSDASQLSGATDCLLQIASTIQNATPNSSGTYEAGLGSTNFSWNLDGKVSTATLSNLSLQGLPTANVSDQRLMAHVEIDAPASAETSGSALISVAWPNRALWNTGTKSWNNAQGSVSACVVFLSGQ